MATENARLQTLQAQMAYDQQKLNIRMSCLQLILEMHKLPQVASPQNIPTADELVDAAKKLEAYTFDGITPPGNTPSLVRVQGLG